MFPSTCVEVDGPSSCIGWPILLNMCFLLAVESRTEAGVDRDEDAADCLTRCFRGADSSSADGERGRTMPFCMVAEKGNNAIHSQSNIIR